VFRAAINVLRLELALEVESTLPVVALAELVAEVSDDELASCSEVRNDRAVAENWSAGPMPGGGRGGGPDRLVGLRELVDALPCPVWAALFAAFVCRLASSAWSACRADVFERFEVCISPSPSEAAPAPRNAAPNG
jgi:hypothetical protein